MKIGLGSLIFLAVLATTLSSRCPHMRGMSNLKPKKFTGIWYVQATNERRWFTRHSCMRSKIIPMRMRGTYAEYQDSYRPFLGPIAFDDSEFIAKKLTQSGKYQKRGEFAEGRKRLFSRTIKLSQYPNYFIIDTDYKNYAITYSCRDRRLGKRETVKLMTRKPIISQKLRNHMYKKAYMLNVPTDRVYQVNQRGCTGRMPSVHSREYKRNIGRLTDLRPVTSSRR